MASSGPPVLRRRLIVTFSVLRVTLSAHGSAPDATRTRLGAACRGPAPAAEAVVARPVDPGEGLIVITAPLIALIGTTSASLVLQYNERQERSVALAASELGSAADRVLADAVNAEASIRGYAAARNPLFLPPYNLTLTRIGAARMSLRDAATTEGETRLQRTADVTTGRVLAELADLRSAISRGVSLKGLRPALENQEATMDLLRRQVSELAGAPAALLVVQRNKITRLEASIDRLDIAGLVLGVLGVLAVLAGALFISSVSRRVAANAANADRLGEGQPLEPDIPSRDEIGSVAGSLLRAAELLASRSAQLTAVRDEALKAAQAKNAFLSHTSHEPRVPLNAILGFTQLLQISDLNSKDRDSAQHILTAGRHLLTLINELIDTSRIESGDLSLSLEPVSVLPLMEEASLLLGPLAAERSIAIAHKSAHPGLAARADRQRFTQVLVNLISNAVKYNRHGGTITISGQEKGPSQVTVVVSDTGRGKAQEDLERIFLPFERLGAGETSIEGTGIGLPLAGALTQAMGGQLTASSVPGQGSAFAVTLPRAPDLIHIPPRAADPATPARGATRILYIEDNPANVEVLSQFLKTRPGPQCGPPRPAGTASPAPSGTFPTSSFSICTCPTPTETTSSTSSRPARSPLASLWWSCPRMPPQGSSAGSSLAEPSPTSVSPSTSPSSTRCSNLCRPCSRPPRPQCDRKETRMMSISSARGSRYLAPAPEGRTP